MTATTPIRRRPLGWTLALVTGASLAFAPQAAPPPQTPATAVVVPSVYAFPSGAGMFFFYVKPDKVADFDGVMARLKEALAKADDPVRKRQALHWSIFKSTEAPKDGVTYVFLFDPAVETADYDPVKLLAEVLPAEAQPLYDRLKDAIVRIERMGLTKIR